MVKSNNNNILCCITNTPVVLLLCILNLSIQPSSGFGVAPFFIATAPSSPSKSIETNVSSFAAAPSLPSKVAVAGATGRTGSLVVEELLNRGVNVVALVRDLDRAQEKLSKFDTSTDNFDEEENKTADNLTILKCDLGSDLEIKDALVGCDAAIWCATGFSDAPGVSVFDKVKRLLGIALTPKRSIDAIGIPAIADAFQKVDGGFDNETQKLPKVVMLSSAGVTRPQWDDAKKEKFSGCADIPIVRLNPFGILDIKSDSEEKLRQSGVSYCIFRPTGLNDDWPANSRPVFSQGDLAVGRINRKDVAKILVDCLTTPEATGKTFEAFAMTGYMPPPSIAAALGRLRLDSEGPLSEDILTATYSAMQQLLPGEKQDAASLAMGQTYEQLDKGEIGRFGERGKEDAEAAVLNSSS